MMNTTGPATTKPCMHYLHTFNDVGGRPDERLGSRGSFTPGVRIMSGGQRTALQTPPETEENPNRGKVLFVSATLKPDLSLEARTNVVGGRPTERLGSRGSFTPGNRKRFLGGTPRDVPLAAPINPGKVLFVSSIHQPDLSGEARVNAVRPTERLGSHGRFTPGVRVMSGGPRPRSVDAPVKTSPNHGNGAVVLHVSTTLKPDMSGEARFNSVGGRPTERLGSRGSFTPGARAWLGGAPGDVPLETGLNPGKVLFVSSVHKADLRGEAHTNLVGGRPTERLGSRGSFTPGARRWLGGEPRDVPAEREVEDHGTVLFPRPCAPREVDDECSWEETGAEAEEEAEVGVEIARDERQPLDAVYVPVNHSSSAAAAVVIDNSNGGGRGMVKRSSSSVLLRSCGSDTSLSALASENPRTAF